MNQSVQQIQISIATVGKIVRNFPSIASVKLEELNSSQIGVLMMINHSENRINSIF